MKLWHIILLLHISTCVNCQDYDVIVIGAGASGLSAARKLTNEKKFKVTILEARPDRYGGRIWTNMESFPEAAGPEVDMGASYIHFPVPDQNSALQLHMEFGLDTVVVNYSSGITIDEQTGRRYTEKEYNSYEDKVHKTFQSGSAYAEKLQSDISIQEALDRMNLSSTISDPMSQLMVSIQEFWFGDSIDKLGAKHLYVSNEGWEETDFIPTKGYKPMLDRIVQNGRTNPHLDILFGKEVTQVEVDGNETVRVTCRDGSLYSAGAAILTVPLGVLKADVVNFIPELPKRKRDAIERVGFGVVNKLILEFSRRFWPEDAFELHVALQNTTNRGMFSTFACFGAVSDQPILMTFAVSDFGLESEAFSDEQLKNVAVTNLRTIFGSAMDGVTVVRMSRTRWFSDPFSRGSYTQPTVGTLAQDWDTIGEAVPPLFFAGEHTRTLMYATVYNAIDTGRRAATQASNYLIELKQANKCAQILLSYTLFFASVLLSSF